MRQRPTRRRAGDGGYTLLEVLVAILVALVGLLGTVAVQQAILSQTANAGDASIATRLAMASLEQFSVYQTASSSQDDLAPLATGAWTATQYLNANGTVGALGGNFRFGRRTRVANPGAGQPYNISVEISYNLDSGRPKTVRLDMERRKTW